MVRKILRLLLFVTIIIGCSISYVFAESGGSYQSKAGVGFTGEYIYPDEEPNTGDQPNKNGSNAGNQSHNAGRGSSSSKGGHSATLPQTGETASNYGMSMGVLFIACACLLMCKRNPQKSYSYRK